jgi:membrane associated rhomboid family serine protease
MGGAVKALLILNVGVFVLQRFDGFAGGEMLVNSFGLRPSDVTQRFFLWQLVTYIFLHGSFMHILFNMFFLWMFGGELERRWGRNEFFRYFFVCGIGAGICSVIVSPGSGIPTIGASGAIYGILLAYGLLFPRRMIYVWGILPIQARYLVMILGGIAFLSSFGQNSGGAAHIAHLGGMVVGYIYLRGPRFRFGLRQRYADWQRERLRRKFEVYYNRKQAKRERDEGRDDDHWRWKN